jgi:hypothetical protein
MSIDTFLGPGAQEYLDLQARADQLHEEGREHKRRKEDDLIRGLFYIPTALGGITQSVKAVEREYEHAVRCPSIENSVWADQYAAGAGVVGTVLLAMLVRGITSLFSWRRHAKAEEALLRKERRVLSALNDQEWYEGA